MPKPIYQRPLDLIYLIFFTTHLPIIFLVDITPLYPSIIHITFPFLNQIRAWYVDTYKDRFFGDWISPAPLSPPAWFKLFIWMEAVVHVPVSWWCVGALVRDDPLIPTILLPFSTQVALTTSICIIEYLSWPDFSTEDKIRLGGLYVPYLCLALVMFVDMFLRLRRQVGRAELGTEGGVRAEKKRA